VEKGLAEVVQGIAFAALAVDAKVVRGRDAGPGEIPSGRTPLPFQYETPCRYKNLLTSHLSSINLML
jgi:hypothetical protein